QHIGKAARGAADVERHRSSHIEAEMGETVVKLDPPARHPRMILAANLERRVLGEHLAGFGQLLLAREHRSGHDQRLSPRPALGEPAAYQQLVGALPRHQPKSWEKMAGNRKI